MTPNGVQTQRGGSALSDDGRLPWELQLGAHPTGHGETRFRVWAPRAESVALAVGEFESPMQPAGFGVFETVAAANAGDDYWFVLDGRRLPDPASRWQPEGLRGCSRVLEPLRPEPFARPALDGVVIYEMHVGTFTARGTFEAAIPHLRELAELGVGALEIMPVAEFPGARGWGYDGVYISAAQSSYGGPFGLSQFVRAAHDAGLAVILDVVYNHVGASGVKALEAFGPYFTDKYETPWGRAINYDDADCDPVREWVIQSATGWIRDFGIDGLRLDAIHAIFDASAEHIVRAVARRVHDLAPDAWVIAESGLNDPRVMRDVERGGWGCDSAWADDFHHSLRAVLSDERDGYYADFGLIAQIAKSYRRPFVHDGSWSGFRRRRFGAPAHDLDPANFVVFSQNHDQVGNRALGDRMPPEARPLAAFCTLLSPFVPMLFMGEEYGEPAPFQFFSDHIDSELAEATREGRRKEFASFAQFAGEEIPDPQDPRTFERSKLTRRGDETLAKLYAQLLSVRRELPSGDIDGVEFDEQSRWLRVRRGPYELVCNFAKLPARVRCEGDTVVLSTHAEPSIAEGFVELAAMSGALIR